MLLATDRVLDEAERVRLDIARLPTYRRVVICPNGTKLELRPHDIGIGISQVVPVVVTALDGQDRLLAIEQPELHLHPRLQAELGDLFIEGALGDRKHRILLETHSEHLILRLLRRIRETANDKPHRGLAITDADVAIYYVKSHLGGSIFTRIDVYKNGDFIQPWPDDFFEIDFYERFGNAG